MTTFGEYTRTIVRRGRVEAHESGSATIEAEHLLLAISSQRATVAQTVLASVGLSREAIRTALRREFERSLSAAGVYIGDLDLPPVGGDSGRPAHLGTSAKLAIHRALTFAPRQRLQPAHLLLGVLSAKVGTVPRALALAGVDRADLTERARRATTAARE
jgi:ATP-dependent Clp protease ATP-binding subunit ClpA